MKHQTLLSTLTLISAVLLFAGNTFCQQAERWWQRERLTPTQNQTVNPKYIEVKRALEQLWDKKEEAITAQRNFSSRGQRTTAIRKAVADITRQIAEKEQVLQGISPYIDKPQELPSSAQIHQPLNITKKVTAETPDTIYTFGNRVRFQLDLSQWSTAELVRFTNDFKGTGDTQLFGIRIFPGEHVLNIIRSHRQSLARWQKMGVNPSKVYRDYSEVYIPKEWSEDSRVRYVAIAKMEEMLAKGKPVFIQLQYDGDYVSIRLPEGVYFLNYVMITQTPTQFSKKRWFGISRNPGKCRYGPYFIQVSNDKNSPVTYKPIPHLIGHDNRVEYYDALRDLGAEALVLQNRESSGLEPTSREHINQLDATDLTAQKRAGRGHLGVLIIEPQILGDDEAQTLFRMNSRAEVLEAYGLNEENRGVLIGKVLQGSPAAAGGLAVGDLIVALDGEKVENVAGLCETIAATPPGTKTDITIMQNGERKTITVEIGGQPGTSPVVASAPSSLTFEKMGFKAQTLTPSLANALGYTKDLKGAIVTDVASNSPAAQSDLRPNDVIVSVGLKDIANAKQLADEATQSGEGVRAFRVKRGEDALFITIITP